MFRFKFKGQLYLQVLLFQNQDKAGAVELLHCRTNREALTGFSGSEDALAEFENNKSDQSPIPVCSTFFFVSRHHHTFTPTATAKCAKNTTKKKHWSTNIDLEKITHNANITKSRAFTQEINCNHPLKIIVVCCLSSVCKCGPVTPLVCQAAMWTVFLS